MTTRWTVNINDTERGARIAVGAMAVLGGVFLLIAAGTALSVMLEVLLIAAGLDLVVTGATGHCPLYARLGHIPPSLQGRTS
jgi:hypothetical protein